MENTKEIVGYGWDDPTWNIAQNIFDWLDRPTMIRMSQLSKAWGGYVDKYCKPIVLKHISPPKTEPTSWKALFASHQLALTNLQSGKHGLLPQKQERVDAIFSYGDEPDKVPNHLVLMKEDGKRIERWDLAGNPETLWNSDTPLTPTEVTWGEEGPEFMLFNSDTFQWALLRLNDATKNVSGKERSWAPKDLSEQYLSLARGNRIGVWDDLSTTCAQPGFLPIPLQKTNGTPHFILHHGDNLKVNTQEGGGEIELSQAGWLDANPSSFLRVQPTTNGPTYLAGINQVEELITLWNTKTWEKKESRLRGYDRCGNANTPMQYFKSGGDHYLASLRRDSCWLSKFNPETGEFVGKTQVLGQTFNRIFAPFIYQAKLILSVQKHLPGEVFNMPACLSIWNIKHDSKSPLTVCQEFNMPNLRDAALCINSNGQLTLSYLSGDELQVIDLQKKLAQLPKYSIKQSIFRILNPLPTADFAGFMIFITLFLVLHVLSLSLPSGPSGPCCCCKNC